MRGREREREPVVLRPIKEEISITGIVRVDITVFYFFSGRRLYLFVGSSLKQGPA